MSTPSSTSKSASRRPRGTGGLFVKRDSSGRETWYGKWRVGAVQVKRRIGPKRIPSSREGMTRSEAEAELRRQMGSIDHAVLARERVTIEEVGALVMENRRVRGRKKATIEAYGSMTRVHLVPYFGNRTLDQIDRRAIQTFVAHMLRGGSSPKTTRNALGVLHSIFEHAR
ncbi:MAG TPA: phage integrase N-terminal SAM-like domain-containing protein, partial [Solirubrobacteraceae bacterium]|nr:phage integrase N-terminal SAM-like domain-containing protein [Solirubrobacteraceae bacterium]